MLGQFLAGLFMLGLGVAVALAFIAGFSAGAR